MSAGSPEGRPQALAARVSGTDLDSTRATTEGASNPDAAGRPFAWHATITQYGQAGTGSPATTLRYYACRGTRWSDVDTEVGSAHRRSADGQPTYEWRTSLVDGGRSDEGEDNFYGACVRVTVATIQSDTYRYLVVSFAGDGE